MQLPSQADQGRSLDMALKNCKGHLLSLFRMSVAATHGAYSSTWRLSVSTYMLQGGAYLQYPNAPCPDRLSRIIHHNDFADSQGNRVPSKIELPYRNCVTSRSKWSCNCTIVRCCRGFIGKSHISHSRQRRSQSVRWGPLSRILSALDGFPSLYVLFVCAAVPKHPPPTRQPIKQHNTLYFTWAHPGETKMQAHHRFILRR